MCMLPCTLILYCIIINLLINPILPFSNPNIVFVYFSNETRPLMYCILKATW